MRKNINKFLIVSVWLLFCFASSEALTLTMPLEQVKAGMKGSGKTVFAENKIEEFEVEIIGVLYNIQPKKNIILAKLKGMNFDKTGVIAGMSGSPVYIEGKLIGAIAYSFPYAKEAIAGITPIGEMLSVSTERIKPSSFSPPRITFRQSLSLEDLFGIYKDLFYPKQDFIIEGQTCTPLRIPLVFSGFSSDVVERAQPLFSKLGFYPVKSGGRGQILESTPPPSPVFQEGEPVAIQLISGDLDMSAVGTVTYVDKNLVLAFGHPLYNLGAVDYAMAKAKVVTVIPSLESSFKLTNTEQIVGSFSQDRTSGALGEIGRMPKLIPLNITMAGENNVFKEFKLKIVNDKILSPALVNVTLLSLLSSEERAFGNLSLEMEADIYLDNQPSVHLEDLYSGNFNTSMQDLSGIMTAVIYFLSNNEFKDVGIFKIDLTIRSSEQPKFSYLERIWLDKYEVLPGERIELKIYFRTFKEKSFVEVVPILAPTLPSGSEFQLVVADAASMHQVEMSLYKAQDFVPRSFNQLIRILNNLRKNNRIYFKVIASKPGLFLKGEEMPNLPPTMKSMFTSPRAASSPTELSLSTLNEYQLPVDYVFKGMAVIPIKIRK